MNNLIVWSGLKRVAAGVIVLLFSCFCYADLTQIIYTNNSQYQLQFHDNNIMFDSLVDVAILKVNNDPANNDSPKFSQLPTIFALDGGLNRIVWNAMDPADKYWTFHAASYEFSNPKGIASNGNNKVIVADTFNDRLVEFSVQIGSDGIDLVNPKIIGGTGTQPGQFNKPYGVCYDGSGNIWVADTNNFRVQSLYPTGLPRSVVSVAGSSYFNTITDIAVSYFDTGTIYVCDYGKNSIIRLDNNGNFLSQTPANVQNNYYKIDIDKDNNIYATTKGNNPNDFVYVLSSDLNSIVSTTVLDVANNGTGIGICNNLANGVWKTLGKAATAGNDKICFYSIGTGITQFFSAANSIWINQNTKVYYPIANNIRLKTTSPGGDYTIEDYSNLNVLNPFQQSITSTSTAGGLTYVDFVPLKTNGDADDNGLHTLVLQIAQADYSDYSSSALNQISIIYDTTPPTIEDVSFDANSSLMINDILNVSNETIFHINGGNDLADSNNVGSGIFDYQYQIGSDSTGWSGWRDVSPYKPQFTLNSTDNTFATNKGYFYLQYRAIDNVYNTSNAYAFNYKVILGSVLTFTPSCTYTINPTLTTTTTSTNTEINTLTCTPTITVTLSPTVSLVLLYKSADNNLNTNSPHPMFRLQNNDLRTIDLSKIIIKYWYNYEGTIQPEIAVVDYAGKQPTGTLITGNTQIFISTNDFGGQDRCLSITFDPGADGLSTAGYVDINTRFNKQDWSPYNQLNDWSYLATTDYTQWNKVTVYYDGVLIWGIEPLILSPTQTNTYTETATITPIGTQLETYTVTSTEISTITVTATPSATSTYTYTITKTYTLTPSATITATMVPTSTTHRLNLLVRNAGSDTCSGTNVFNYDVKIVNYDSVGVNIHNLTVKMWLYTASDNVNINGAYDGTIYNSSGGWVNNTSTSLNVNNNSPSPACTAVSDRKTNRLVTLSFTTSYNIPANGGYADSLSGQLYSGNWVSPFDNNCDDYSKLGSNSYHDDVHFGLYENDVIVSEWTSVSAQDINTGTEPCGIPTATLTPVATATPINTATGYGILSIGKITPIPTQIEALNEKNVYNFPNPFSGETTIRFSLDKMQNVNILIFDSNGKLVWKKDINAGKTKPGINYAIWKGNNNNGQRAASGVYLLEVSTKDKSAIKKIAMINGAE